MIPELAVGAYLDLAVTSSELAAGAYRCWVAV